MVSDNVDMEAAGVSSQDHWQSTLIWLAVVLTGITLIHMQTAARAVELWSSSSAYNYAFLVLPISAYLIWEDRQRVLREQAAPSLLGVAVLLFFSVAWLVADAIGINEGRQLSLVGLYQGALLTILGVRIFRILLFPFTYLWLLVPTGEFLVPSLQQITTFGSVWLLELSQIPTYYEGFLIQVPAGNFIVEPGCSGLNFILSSLALSLLYGKLTYRRWRTRLVCIFVAIAVSIISNIVRVYLIIALTQVTDRQLNIADDHLLYGWGFFAVIMLFMMWFGLKYEDQTDDRASEAIAVSTRSNGFAAVSAASVLVVVLAYWPIGLRAAIVPTQDARVVQITLPENIGPWQRSSASADWKPVTVAGASTGHASYLLDDMAVDFFLAYFPFQSDTFEPQASGNAVADPAVWNTVRRGAWALEAAGVNVTGQHTFFRSYAGPRHTVELGFSGDCITNSKLMSRLCGAAGRYGLGRSDGALLVLSVRGSDEDKAFSAISSLVSHMEMIEFVRSVVPEGSPLMSSSDQ